jgi:hypothetical protein
MDDRATPNTLQEREMVRACVRQTNRWRDGHIATHRARQKPNGYKNEHRRARCESRQSASKRHTQAGPMRNEETMPMRSAADMLALICH